MVMLKIAIDRRALFDQRSITTAKFAAFRLDVVLKNEQVLSQTLANGSRGRTGSEVKKTSTLSLFVSSGHSSRTESNGPIINALG